MVPVSLYRYDFPKRNAAGGLHGGKQALYEHVANYDVGGFDPSLRKGGGYVVFS